MKNYRDITLKHKLIAWAFLILLMNFVAIKSLHCHDIAEVQHFVQEQQLSHSGIAASSQNINLDCPICMFVISSAEEASLHNAIDCPLLKMGNPPLFDENATFTRHIALNSHSPPAIV